jgi:hypothetical protein
MWTNEPATDNSGPDMSGKSMLKASFALDCSRQLVNKHLQNQNTKNEKI